MTQRIFVLTVFLFVATAVDAAMLRVVAIEDAGTIVVESAGVSVRLHLAGIVIDDPAAAKLLLEWTLVSRWVMVEPREDGGHFVYRSPDALFVNRELVLRGYARATLREVEPESHVIVTYLGRVDPGSERPAVRPAPAPGTGSGTSRRPKGAPSRKRRRR